MKIRLDVYLVENGFCKTRSQAQIFIKKNMVKVNKDVINKTSFLVSNNDLVEIIKTRTFVSNGGYKLQKIFDELNINIKDKVVCDLGSSTGGFSDCCLQFEAKKVYCVDVGENLLDKSIRYDNRVVNYEKTNVKDLNKGFFREDLDVIVADLSFISLTKVIDIIKSICNDNTQLFLLIKPQFELTKQIISKNKGVIKDEKYIQQAIKSVCDHIKLYGFKLNYITKTDLYDEKKQNQEYMVYLSIK